jgi:deoxyribose-phosphate aldolase
MGTHAWYTIDRKRIAWDEIDGETLIINVETGFYFSLDDVGSLIWSMLADGADEPDMVARIVSEYAVEESTARDDLQALIDALADEELVERRSESGAQPGEEVR